MNNNNKENIDKENTERHNRTLIDLDLCLNDAFDLVIKHLFLTYGEDEKYLLNEWEILNTYGEVIIKRKLTKEQEKERTIKTCYITSSSFKEYRELIHLAPGKIKRVENTFAEDVFSDRMNKFN